MSDSIIDLDSFLAGTTGPKEGPRNVTTTSMPDSDRLVVAGLSIDDSGSMRDQVASVIQGCDRSIEALRGARGCDFYLDARCFKGQIFSGFLKDVDENTFKDYIADWGTTPLISLAMSHIDDLRRIAKKYADQGIAVSIAQMILTDGLPYCDSYQPSAFRSKIMPGDYIVGIGIVSNSDDSFAVNKYRELFAQMGIANVFTPSSNPADIRHAINQFSRSVAAMASQ